MIAPLVQHRTRLDRDNNGRSMGLELDRSSWKLYRDQGVGILIHHQQRGLVEWHHQVRDEEG